jgi:hypothetical protein
MCRIPSADRTDRRRAPYNIFSREPLIGAFNVLNLIVFTKIGYNYSGGKSRFDLPYLDYSSKNIGLCGYTYKEKTPYLILL